jgi:ribosome assembly protein YihI (activator of Der GTPase)
MLFYNDYSTLMAHSSSAKRRKKRGRKEGEASASAMPGENTPERMKKRVPQVGSQAPGAHSFSFRLLNSH